MSEKTNLCFSIKIQYAKCCMCLSALKTNVNELHIITVKNWVVKFLKVQNYFFYFNINFLLLICFKI